MSSFYGLRPANRSFFARDVLEVAPEFLGCVLQRTDTDGTVSLRITEVQAPSSSAIRA